MKNLILFFFLLVFSFTTIKAQSTDSTATKINLWQKIALQKISVYGGYGFGYCQVYDFEENEDGIREYKMVSGGYFLSGRIKGFQIGIDKELKKQRFLRLNYNIYFTKETKINSLKIGYAKRKYKRRTYRDFYADLGYGKLKWHEGNSSYNKAYYLHELRGSFGVVKGFRYMENLDFAIDAGLNIGYNLKHGEEGGWSAGIFKFRGIKREISAHGIRLFLLVKYRI